MGTNGTDITRLEDLPPELEPYIEKILLQLSSRGISIDAPNQVTVARYEPGSGIGDHVDAEALGKYVLDLNLRCPVPMHLRHLKGGHHYVITGWIPVHLHVCEEKPAGHTSMQFPKIPWMKEMANTRNELSDTP